MIEILRTLSGDWMLLLVLLAAWLFTLLAINDLAVKILRSRNIRHHGWPPPHCDADGDPTGWEPEQEEATAKHAKE